jgi:hypothetical protein
MVVPRLLAYRAGDMADLVIGETSVEMQYVSPNLQSGPRTPRGVV